MVPPILYKNIGSYVSWAQISGQLKQVGTTIALIAGTYSAKEKANKNVVKAGEDKPETNKVKPENRSTTPKVKPPPLY